MKMTKTPARRRKKDPNVYPPDLNRAKVEKLIAYYDAHQDDDVLGDDVVEANAAAYVWVEVPQDLVPKVQKLIANHRKSA